MKPRDGSSLALHAVVQIAENSGSHRNTARSCRMLAREVLACWNDLETDAAFLSVLQIALDMGSDTTQADVAAEVARLKDGAVAYADYLTMREG